MEPAHVSTDAEMASLPHTEAVPVSEATNGATSFLTLPAGGNARAGGAGLRELKTQQARPQAVEARLRVVRVG